MEKVLLILMRNIIRRKDQDISPFALLIIPIYHILMGINQTSSQNPRVTHTNLLWWGITEDLEELLRKLQTNISISGESSR